MPRSQALPRIRWLESTNPPTQLKMANSHSHPLFKGPISMPWIARTGRELSRFFINSIHNFPIFLSLSHASPFPVIYQFKLNIFLSCYHHQHIKNAKTTTQTKIQITNNQKKKKSNFSNASIPSPRSDNPTKIQKAKKKGKNQHQHRNHSFFKSK